MELEIADDYAPLLLGLVLLLLLLSLNNSFFLFLLGLRSAEDDLKGVEQFGVIEIEISEDLRF